MDDHITFTSADIQRLVTENALAGEQLRRFVLEREMAALKAEMAQHRNGTEAPVPVTKKSAGD